MRLPRHREHRLRDPAGCDSLVPARPKSDIVAWTDLMRPKYRREGLPYAGDTSMPNGR